MLKHSRFNYLIANGPLVSRAQFRETKLFENAFIDIDYAVLRETVYFFLERNYSTLETTFLFFLICLHF